MRTTISGFLLLVGIALVLTAGELLLQTQREEQTAQQYSADMVTQFFQAILPQSHPDSAVASPSSEWAPAPTQPTTVALDGMRYLAILSIPQLALELPIADELTDAQLKHTPAVFDGTVEDDDLIIGGHNYKSHFGGIYQLTVGDEISLLAVDGTLHSYTLTSQQEISEDDLPALYRGDWDLTLFTCLYEDNALRTVLRFTR